MLSYYSTMKSLNSHQGYVQLYRIIKKLGFFCPAVNHQYIFKVQSSGNGSQQHVTS